MSWCTDAPTKHIPRIKDERRFRGNESCACDAGQQLRVTNGDAAFKDAPNHTFLAPDLAGSHPPFRIQAGQLGTGASSARGAVVLLAWTEHEVTAVNARCVRGAVELDVI